MLEQAIAENTNAIRELIAAIKAGVPTTAAQVAAVVTESSAAGAVKETVTKNGTSSKPAVSSTPSAPADVVAQTPAPAAAPAAPVAASVTYEDVKAAVVKLSNAKGRDATVAVLGEFGAAKGPELKPEQYAAFIARATEAAGA